MDEIKSAREIAAEKIEKLGEATEDERLSWKYRPEGEKLATKYLKEDLSLAPELAHYEGKAKKYFSEGVASVLVRSIGLPASDAARKLNKRAIDGLKLAKAEPVAVENIFSQMRRIFDHYSSQGEQQRKQAYEALRSQFEMQLRQALQQQTGMAGNFPIDVTHQAQFQAEWRREQARLDAQYLRLLDELKQALLALP